MSELVLTRDERLALRREAHHLEPVVLMGANGDTPQWIAEIDRALTQHELIKVKVPSDEREYREELFSRLADQLSAARVQMIGKLLILYRPSEVVQAKLEQEALRQAQLTAKTMSIAGKKVASKKPGMKKTPAKPTYVHNRRKARSKKARTTKKAAMG